MAENYERISVAEAAKMIGTTSQMVRFYMRKGKWKIGMVMPSQTGSKKYHQYFIYKQRVEKLLEDGIKEAL